jgi:hypothetical protein
MADTEDIATEARHFLARAYAEYGDQDSADKILAGDSPRWMHFPLSAIESAIRSERSKRAVVSYGPGFVDKSQWTSTVCVKDIDGKGKSTFVSVMAKGLAPQLKLLEQGFQNQGNKIKGRADE